MKVIEILDKIEGGVTNLAKMDDGSFLVGIIYEVGMEIQRKDPAVDFLHTNDEAEARAYLERARK